MPLFRRVVVHAERPGLYFIGLLQPLGAIMPIAEAQSEWIADVLEGKVALPAADEMKRVIEREDDLRCASATWPRPGTPSRWTSSRTCARSRAKRRAAGGGAHRSGGRPLI